MDIETFRKYCLSKQLVTEEFPFGETTLVFKVLGKMFALTGLESSPYQISLKCDPDWAIELREEFDGLITSAYHLNKKHWNSLSPESLPNKFVEKLIDHSYNLVVAKLPKKQRERLLS